MKKQFKQLLASGETIHIPGAYDALSAQLIARAGVPIGYIGSYATAAARLGLPDVGVLTLDDMVSSAAAVSNAVNVPVLADAEDGFFDAGNIWRTVQAFESAGVVGIHIEDHGGGKHTHLQQQLVPVDTMVGRIKAAVEAKRDPDFQIIARTDAVWVHQDINEALERMLAYQEAGADLLMPTGVSLEQLSLINEKASKPLVAVGGPGFLSGQDLNGLASLVIYYGTALFAASHAVSHTVSRFLESGSNVESVTDCSTDPHDFEKIMGYQEYTDRVKKYGS